MTARPAGGRPRLLLYVARYANRNRNAVAATLAWIAEETGRSFEVYYDAFRLGRHYGSGEPEDIGLRGSSDRLGWLTGSLVAGGRHLEAAALALQRFETTVVCSGDVAFANLLTAVAPESGADVLRFDEDDVAGLYDGVLSRLGVTCPGDAVMLNATPKPALEGVDAYLYPEIFYPKAIGLESSVSASALDALRERGIERIRTAGVDAERCDELRRRGFDVEDLGLVRDTDDFASITHRVAMRWKHRRKGWILGDPVVTSYWLPVACREDRAAIFGVPQSRVIELLDKEIGGQCLPAILGRQFHDSDFFTLSRLGQSFQVIDPGRPPLPVLQTLDTPWSASTPDPRSEEPTDAELHDHLRNGRTLVSLVFWTGMIREVENLYALTDLVATTGLRAGVVLTTDSVAYRPSPLDLLTVPRDQGGVFPHLEILLGSCGTGVSIESLMSPDQLNLHLKTALCELRRRGLPESLLPEGWWSTMDVPLTPLPRAKAPKPVRLASRRPYLRIRFHPRTADAPPSTASNGHSANRLRDVRRRARTMIRGSAIESLFEAYRPYECFGPGALDAELAASVKDAGLSYMLTKAGFGEGPRVVHRDGDFVALNYTAGRWDGWTPFETINDVSDLRRAERSLLKRKRPGWLLGTIDTCLWAFSGELWHAAPRLAAIAEHVASGGTSGELINVTPRVVARYARLMESERVAP